MVPQRRYVIEAAVLLLLSAAVIAPWGCSPAPLAPAPVLDGITLELPNGTIAVPGRQLGETEPAEPGTFELAPLPYILDSTVIKDTTLDVYGPFVEDITASGGTIILDVARDTSYFIVPDEGLKSTTQISVRVMRDLSLVEPRITEFQFSPDGLKFDLPAELAYRTDLPDGDALMLYWWDEETKEWVKSVEATVVKGYATFPIEHFSKYRTIERISLGGQRNRK